MFSATHKHQVCDSWWTSWTDWHEVQVARLMTNKCANHDEQAGRWKTEEYKMFSVRNLEASFWRWYSVEALRPPFGDDTRPYLPENTRPPIIHDPQSIKYEGKLCQNFPKIICPSTSNLLSPILNHRIDNPEYKLTKPFPSPKPPSYPISSKGRNYRQQ